MTDNIIQKIARRTSKKRAAIIDKNIREVVPAWQVSFLKRNRKLFSWIFGWELDFDLLARLDPDSDYEIIYIKRWGKVVRTLRLNYKYKFAQ